MNQVLNLETLRLIASVILSSLLSLITPSAECIEALGIAFGVNLWCGMRADGVVIHSCKNWNGKKFMDALKMLALYAAIILAFSTICQLMKAEEYGMTSVRTITWVFILAYLQNSAKNLVKAYPTSVPLMYIYLIIRLEWKKLISEDIEEKLKEFQERQNKQKENESTTQENC